MDFDLRLRGLFDLDFDLCDLDEPLPICSGSVSDSVNVFLSLLLPLLDSSEDCVGSGSDSSGIVSEAESVEGSG
ncbi:MAG: hypothetical protein EBU90_22530 [Proteobacteria bacterium]|nr:hypothetical protein [Pseudomonadota bacterium]